MKKTIYLLALLIQFNVGYAQNRKVTIDTVTSGKKVVIDTDRNWVGSIGKDNSIFAKTYPKVSLNGYQPDDRSFALIHYFAGAKQIELFANLPKDSIKYYRYSTIANDYSSLAKDKVPEITSNPINFPDKKQISLGRYNIENSKLAVKLYKIDDDETSIELCFYNKNMPKIEVVKAVVREYPEVEGMNAEKVLKDGIIATTAAYDIFLEVKGIDKNVPYEVGLIREFKGKKDTVYRKTTWVIKDFGNQLFSGRLFGTLPPGKYSLIVYPYLEKMTSKHASVIKFDVKYIWLTSERLLMLMLVVFFVLVSIFVFVYILIKKRNKKKLLESLQQMEISKMKLETVRSQLNPHFMFNALAGIQNLMNKNRVEEANQYLSKFARLTRNVLANREMINLLDEKTLLDDYLQMEQLRFGFTYRINVDEKLNINNVEIPSMLLQPFVENTVKHGIAEKANHGIIEVNFLASNKDLILKISDNGEGFNTSQNYQGFGLQLSKNRISLLNTIHKETPFILDISSTKLGTIITITLTQWL